MITVITPVFNGERFIEGCIDSVAKQGVADVEHVIVDGGSTDRTVELIQRKASEVPNLRFISKPDTGQSQAMNRGIRLARGEIIGFLNVDDWYEEGVLGRVGPHFRSLSEPAMVVGNCNVRSKDRTVRYVNRPSELRLTHLLRGWRRYPYPMNPSAYFYHRSLHDVIGPYDENDQLDMDIHFVFRALQVATIVYVDEVWGNFWQVEGSKSLVSAEEGTMEGRLHAVFRHYRRTLPPHQRFRAALECQLSVGHPGRMLRFLMADPVRALSVWGTKPWRLISRRTGSGGKSTTCPTAEVGVNGRRENPP